MEIRINIDRFYRDKSYKKQVQDKLQYAVFLLKIERIFYTLINPLAFKIIEAINNRDLNFLQEYRNKRVLFGYSPFKDKIIDLILK
ncbi:hypothetical protein G8V03_09655 [Clostridium botulinum D/C]|uniref:hypothetical protein n=1 Tax=Clostridium botulinum TaxID=1491 RepID=UPI001E2B07B0|nr:hypothetical protein [Clostridium botulinum]MCD3351251.1 hypothetical protein [Clostridium botulinum D/C]MCD3360208.1 hypothetical protein [Clostridium botulinum D/C]MCD3361689.1 hypothetical protein [Clostridium botulinum D/C]MCD3366013.1 hypothetical protein [Clostridium botulinum D/C]